MCNFHSARLMGVERRRVERGRGRSSRERLKPSEKETELKRPLYIHRFCLIMYFLYISFIYILPFIYFSFPPLSEALTRFTPHLAAPL